MICSILRDSGNCSQSGQTLKDIQSRKNIFRSLEYGRISRPGAGRLRGIFVGMRGLEQGARSGASLPSPALQTPQAEEPQNHGEWDGNR